MSIKAKYSRVGWRGIAGNLLALCALFSPVVAHAAQLPPPAQREINFARDIQPIFERSCLRCHGPEKPKSGFRLDNREGALAGGDNGKAIIPGDSTNSALIRIVAGAHEDIERMPPKDKGDPLTDEEISTLRAWIDQGAQWSDAAVADAGARGGETGLQRQGSVTPAWRWIGVSGDEQKFREHFWTKEGSHAGLEQFVLTDRLSPNSNIKVDGRLWPGEDDFRVAVRYDRTDVGFIDAGVDQFVKYYDNSGGFFRAFDPPLYTLDQDLALRIGKAWIDFGLTLPKLPKLSVGYEYQYRKGTKSTLQWGPVRSTSLPELPEVSVTRSIYPAFKEIDEKVHILKLDLTHEFAGIFAEDNFRAEFYDIKTERHNALSVIEGQTTPAISTIVDEGQDQFRAVNALRAEKEIRPWWFVSAGYLSSTAEADATFRQTTEHATGLPISGDFWQSHAIILEQDSVLLNGSTRLGPWQDFVLRAGVQAEYLRQEGMGRVSHDTGNPATFLLIQPATLDANLNKNTLRESTELRFTGLPFTSIFAEARLEQEALDNFEDEIGVGQNFTRDTDSSSELQDWRVGLYSSPLRSVSFGVHYRQRNKHTDYDDRIDTTPGYPAFIRERRIGTEEVEATLTWRPRSWLKATLSYQIVDTEFRSNTDAITNVTPGGPLLAGTFNADVYCLNLMLTPFSRWYFSATANYYDSRAISSDNGVPSIVPYEGDVLSVLGSATCTINTNTELTASYTFSMADYAQDNAAAGLPLGINYDWHVVQAGVTRRFRNASVNLRYAFYRYHEPSSGGFNDYTAHAVFAALTLRWP